MIVMPTLPTPALDYAQVVRDIDQFIVLVDAKERSLRPFNFALATLSAPTAHLGTPTGPKFALPDLTPRIEVYWELLEPRALNALRTDTWTQCRNTTAKAQHIRHLAIAADTRLKATGAILSTSDLHPKIWTPPVQSLWRNQNYADAARKAGETAVGHLRVKLHSQAKAHDLMVSPFATKDKPNRLTFPDLDVGTQDWTDQHDGANDLSRACYRLVRNANTHREQELSRTEAFELLAMLSAFARLVDKASLPAGS